jgi:hypothetical protein
VDAAHGTLLNPRRFRINIVIENEASDAAWHGGVLAFGEGEGGATLRRGPIRVGDLVRLLQEGASVQLWRPETQI